MCYDLDGRLTIIQALAECDVLKQQRATPPKAKTGWKTIALAFGLGLAAGAIGAVAITR